RRGAAPARRGPARATDGGAPRRLRVCRRGCGGVGAGAPPELQAGDDQLYQEFHPTRQRPSGRSRRNQVRGRRHVHHAERRALSRSPSLVTGEMTTDQFLNSADQLAALWRPPPDDRDILQLGGATTFETWCEICRYAIGRSSRRAIAPPIGGGSMDQ